MMDAKEVGMLVGVHQEMHVHLQAILQKSDDLDSEAEAPAGPGADNADEEAGADADAEAAAEVAPPTIASRSVTINAVINVA